MPDHLNRTSLVELGGVDNALIHVLLKESHHLPDNLTRPCTAACTISSSLYRFLNRLDSYHTSEVPSKWPASHSACAALDAGRSSQGSTEPSSCSPPLTSDSTFSTRRGSCRLARSKAQPLLPSPSSIDTRHPSWFSFSRVQPSAPDAPPCTQAWKSARIFCPSALKSSFYRQKEL